VAAWVIIIALMLSREYARRGSDLAASELQSRKLIHELGERVKELNCLHQTTKIFNNIALSTSDWLRKVVHAIPPAWQYPEGTAARIALGSIEFTTPGFSQSRWMQRADFTTADGAAGEIEVVYLNEKSPVVEGPFLIEERNLISSLAEIVRSAIDRRIAVESLRVRNDLYAMLARTNRAVSQCTSSASLYREVCEVAVDIGKSNARGSECLRKAA
jgi:methyl-accepting chemotaxis protein